MKVEGNQGVQALEPFINKRLVQKRSRGNCGEINFEIKFCGRRKKDWENSKSKLREDLEKSKDRFEKGEKIQE